MQAIASDVQSLESTLMTSARCSMGGGDWLYNASHYLHMAAQEKGISNEALACSTPTSLGFSVRKLTLPLRVTRTSSGLPARSWLHLFERIRLGAGECEPISPYAVSNCGQRLFCTSYRLPRLFEDRRGTSGDAG